MKTYKFTIGGRTYTVQVQSIEDGLASVVVNGEPYTVKLDAVPSPVERGMHNSLANPGLTAAPNPGPLAAPASAAPSPATSAQAGAQTPELAENVITAPMPGLIIEVMVQLGDSVKTGQTVVRIEAMKMENNIMSPADGVVTEIRTESGKEVQENEILVVLST